MPEFSVAQLPDALGACTREVALGRLRLELSAGAALLPILPVSRHPVLSAPAS